MSSMFWIALELSIQKIGFNVMLSLMVKDLNAFKFDGVVESDNTDFHREFLDTQSPQSGMRHY